MSQYLAEFLYVSAVIFVITAGPTFEILKQIRKGVPSKIKKAVEEDFVEQRVKQVASCPRKRRKSEQREVSANNWYCF